MQISTLGTEMAHTILGLVSFERVMYLRSSGSLAQLVRRKQTQSIEQEYQQIIARHQERILDEVKKQARDLSADQVVGFRWEIKRIELEYVAIIGYGTAIKFESTLDRIEEKAYNEVNIIEKTEIYSLMEPNLLEFQTEPTVESPPTLNRPKIDIGGDSQMGVFRRRIRNDDKDR